MTSPPPYELLDHTADLALRIHGADLPGLFSALGYAVVDQIAAAETIARRDERALDLHAHDLAELVVSYVNELLFRFETERLLLPFLDVQSVSETELHAIARGEPIEPERHRFKGELKAATYHGLTLRRPSSGSAGFTLDVVLDV